VINGNLPKLLIGGGISGCIALLGFMGSGIVTNDRNNTTQHIEIRRESLGGDLEINRSVEKVKDIVTEIRLEQAEQRVILQGIAKKL